MDAVEGSLRQGRVPVGGETLTPEDKGVKSTIAEKLLQFMNIIRTEFHGCSICAVSKVQQRHGTDDSFNQMLKAHGYHDTNQFMRFEMMTYFNQSQAKATCLNCSLPRRLTSRIQSLMQDPMQLSEDQAQVGDPLHSFAQMDGMGGNGGVEWMDGQNFRGSGFKGKGYPLGFGYALQHAYTDNMAEKDKSNSQTTENTPLATLEDIQDGFQGITSSWVWTYGFDIQHSDDDSKRRWVCRLCIDMKKRPPHCQRSSDFFVVPTVSMRFCTLDRYKARPVAKGFTQWFGTDYDETLSRLDEELILNFSSFRDLCVSSVVFEDGCCGKTCSTSASMTSEEDPIWHIQKLIMADDPDNKYEFRYPRLFYDWTHQTLPAQFSPQERSQRVRKALPSKAPSDGTCPRCQKAHTLEQCTAEHCHICGRLGHPADECYTMHGRPARIAQADVCKLEGSMRQDIDKQFVDVHVTGQKDNTEPENHSICAVLGHFGCKELRVVVDSGCATDVVARR
ncbi:hypothetical protein V1522DRAFT_394387 [Lipomyces starkeyi]